MKTNKLLFLSSIILLVATGLCYFCIPWSETNKISLGVYHVLESIHFGSYIFVISSAVGYLGSLRVSKNSFCNSYHCLMKSMEDMFGEKPDKCVYLSLINNFTITSNPYGEQSRKIMSTLLNVNNILRSSADEIFNAENSYESFIKIKEQCDFYVNKLCNINKGQL